VLVVICLLVVVVCLLANLRPRAPRHMVNIRSEPQVPRAGSYSLSMRYQARTGPADLIVELNGKSVPFHSERTSGSTTVNLGPWDLKRGGKHVVDIYGDVAVPALTVESIDLVPSDPP
jgi:hypothetical protein